LQHLNKDGLPLRYIREVPLYQQVLSTFTFTNDINPRSEYSKNKKFIKTFVDTGSTIGANSTIICGITLGKYCFIGAGSVVTKDVKPYSLALGNPARHLYWVSRAAQKLVFKDNKAYCLKSNTKYKIENDQCVIL
jgi:UDP-2-acetamido-3-amino-2,3-dideoxy-glucuronate N-acetyltransferase